MRGLSLNRSLIVVVQLVIRVLELVRVWEPLSPRVPLVGGSSRVLIVPSIGASGWAKVGILRSGCLKVGILWCGGLRIPPVMATPMFRKWRRNIVLARLMVRVRKLIGRSRVVVMGLWVEMLRVMLLPLIRGRLWLVLLGRESLILVRKCRGA